MKGDKYIKRAGHLNVSLEILSFFSLFRNFYNILLIQLNFVQLTLAPSYYDNTHYLSKVLLIYKS